MFLDLFEPEGLPPKASKRPSLSFRRGREHTSRPPPPALLPVLLGRQIIVGSSLAIGILLSFPLLIRDHFWVFLSTPSDTVFPTYLSQGAKRCDCVVYLEWSTSAQCGQDGMSKLGRRVQLCYDNAIEAFSLLHSWPLSQIRRQGHTHAIDHCSRG